MEKSIKNNIKVCVLKHSLIEKNMCMKFTASSRKACSGLSLDPAVKSIPQLIKGAIRSILAGSPSGTQLILKADVQHKATTCQYFNYCPPHLITLQLFSNNYYNHPPQGQLVVSGFQVRGKEEENTRPAICIPISSGQLLIRAAAGEAQISLRAELSLDSMHPDFCVVFCCCCWS